MSTNETEKTEQTKETPKESEEIKKTEKIEQEKEINEKEMKEKEKEQKQEQEQEQEMEMENEQKNEQETQQLNEQIENLSSCFQDLFHVPLVDIENKLVEISNEQAELLKQLPKKQEARLRFNKMKELDQSFAKIPEYTLKIQKLKKEMNYITSKVNSLLSSTKKQAEKVSKK
ncbi:biogenesis of lysosome-related organelles complex 1 subunit 6 [Anaeramoeba flamelloides]|uniref:Biogenesis of lysosome-related organelles complex 1 subunit 6 n=1 Tax=Anaeramoeba flamelloides TaxID=1746091 RepID=A0ABQ8YYR4_9EUKA|nr:biogenesis of lysosome-related organelles complex 1 subunit 6 [Anaeramoeba flamelloides]